MAVLPGPVGAATSTEAAEVRRDGLGLERVEAEAEQLFEGRQVERRVAVVVIVLPARCRRPPAIVSQAAFLEW